MRARRDARVSVAACVESRPGGSLASKKTRRRRRAKGKGEGRARAGRGQGGGAGARSQSLRVGRGPGMPSRRGRLSSHWAATLGGESTANGRLAEDVDR